MSRCFFAVAVITAFLTNSASAHPGHGNVTHPDGLMHYLTSPMHVGCLMISAFGVLLITKVFVALVNRFRR